MLTAEQVKSNISNYRIENGLVIDKSNNQLIQNEELILEVKSSVMMYKEANNFFNTRLRGAPENQDYYINKALKVYGLNGEINHHPQNKTIRNILENDGNIQEEYGGNDLLVSEKYSFLCAPKKDYGMAVVKYIAHQRGIDISNLNVSIDLSSFKKEGTSIVNIKYDKSQYIKNQPEQNKFENDIQKDAKVTTSYQHSKAKELNELENQKRMAKQNNDEIAYEFAQNNIEKIIRENQTSITTEQWNSMEVNEQISFVKLKINEAKVLHDKDAFDYWNSNLQILESQKILDIKEQTKTDFSIFIDQLKKDVNSINTEYKEMILDGHLNNEELIILINRLNRLEDDSLLLCTMLTNDKEREILNSIIDMINKGISKMTTIQKDMEESHSDFKSDK